jgi:hypothetical protein
MHVVGIDWSGRRAGERRAIWMAHAHDGVVTSLECGRTRAEVAEHVAALGVRTRRLAVGFDFSFSLPSWFLTARGLATADDLWALAAQDGETWLAECSPPFWGRSGRRRPRNPAELRATELHLRSVDGVRPKSTFQIGGAGSVGTGSVRGFPVLTRLRAAGFRIWPFHDEPTLPVAVEVYPRVFTGAVVKSRADARREHLDAHAPGIPSTMREVAIASEDAFDAFFTARGMSMHADELAALPSIDDGVTRLEGRVWRPAGAQLATWSTRTQPSPST